MSISSELKYVTVEEYLRAEEQASKRHEYVDGRVFVMCGVTRRHNTISVNIISILRSHLRGGGCRAYMSDVKLRVEAANSFYYPDAMVSCDAHDDESVFTNCPVLVVEVLSRSTASIDRREKMLAYKKIESLKEYLIVSQNKQRVELHRKTEQGSWIIIVLGPGAELTLESIPVGPLKISLREIYEDVDWKRNGALSVRENTESYAVNSEDDEDEGGDDEEDDLDW